MICKIWCLCVGILFFVFPFYCLFWYNMCTLSMLAHRHVQRSFGCRYSHRGSGNKGISLCVGYLFIIVVYLIFYIFVCSISMSKLFVQNVRERYCIFLFNVWWFIKYHISVCRVIQGITTDEFVKNVKNYGYYILLFRVWSFIKYPIFVCRVAMGKRGTND
jgi:hypothetical protein